MGSPLPSALTTVTRLGATTVTKTAGTTSAASIINRSFEKDLNAYLGGTSGGAGSLQGIVNYNTANPVEGLKYQQGQLVGAPQPGPVGAGGRHRRGQDPERGLLDALLGDTDVILSRPAARWSTSPTVPVPGPDRAPGTARAAGRNPIGVTFIGKAGGDAALLNAGYAFEQATNVRLAPSWTNPSMFRCVTGSTFFSPHHCHRATPCSPTADGPTETARRG